MLSVNAYCENTNIANCHQLFLRKLKFPFEKKLLSLYGYTLKYRFDFGGLCDATGIHI